jgi:N-acetylglucosamine kinase-like BadF-type ATPase
MGLMLYLGIDGGQTRTRALVADATGRVLGVGVAGPSNHVEMPGGRERLLAAVTGSANAALRHAGCGDIAHTPFAAVYCAMTGEADFKTEIITPAFSARVLAVEHDAPAALEGATLGHPGIIVIAGTGSVVFGRTADGETARAGGWGYVFGDEGGGFGLAREGVRRALDALDGVGPDTDLVGRVAARFGVADLRLLPMVMYNGHVSRDAIAQAARDVIDAWQSGDAVAARVVEAGVAALAARVSSVAHRLRLTAPLVCLTGGVCRSAVYADLLAEGIRARRPEAEVRPARMSPVAGALLLAYRAGGLEVTESMRLRLLDSAIEDRS